MIKITFPDNSVREYAEGISGIEIAKSISNSLAREVVSVSVDEEIWDSTREINKNANNEETIQLTPSQQNLQILINIWLLKCKE